MTHSTLTDFSEFLLRLYGLAQEQPVDQFQESALALVRTVLPFDAAMWGSGTLAPAGLDIDALHLHRTSQGMLQAYEEHKSLDLAAFSVGQHRSATAIFHSPAFYAGSPGLLDFTRRFGHQNMFISGDTHGVTRRTQWLSLYRADVDALCGEDERLLLHALRPHLMQALSMNRMSHLHRRPLLANGPACGRAVAGLRGVVLHTDPLFEELLRTEWEGWRVGCTLPDALVARFRSEPLFKGRRAVVHGRVEHQLLFLQARTRCRADELSARELEIACGIANGQTHKQLAQLLARSPATVRNHVQAIYSKLEVSNAAGLVAALRQVGLPEV
ncbi:MAG: LuxR C-terminal-related transcriptional regulator [Rubrivivax sp.]|nr:LuxR C-terminal-related transcriptional regulator [Rubrivivax sp.]